MVIPTYSYIEVWILHPRLVARLRRGSGRAHTRSRDADAHAHGPRTAHVQVRRISHADATACIASPSCRTHGTSTKTAVRKTNGLPQPKRKDGVEARRSDGGIDKSRALARGGGDENRQTPRARQTAVRKHRWWTGSPAHAGQAAERRDPQGL